MPAVSKAQFRAMMAAKSGHSTLGIPQKVGAEFAAATPHPGELPETAEAETPEEEKAEGGKEEGPSSEYLYKHHKMMAAKANSPGARNVHKKLAAHHKLKMQHEPKLQK